MTNRQRLATLEKIRTLAEQCREWLTPESELDYLCASIEAKCEDATDEIITAASAASMKASADALLLALASGNFTINGKRVPRA